MKKKLLLTSLLASSVLMIFASDFADKQNQKIPHMTLEELNRDMCENERSHRPNPFYAIFTDKCNRDSLCTDDAIKQINQLNLNKRPKNSDKIISAIRNRCIEISNKHLANNGIKKPTLEQQETAFRDCLDIAMVELENTKTYHHDKSCCFAFNDHEFDDEFRKKQPLYKRIISSCCFGFNKPCNKSNTKNDTSAATAAQCEVSASPVACPTTCIAPCVVQSEEQQLAECKAKYEEQCNIIKANYKNANTKN